MGSSEIVKLPAQMCLLLDLSKHLLQPPASHAKRIILTLLHLHIRICSTDWGSGSLLAQEIMYNDIAKPMQLVHIPLAVRYNPSELTALKKKMSKVTKYFSFFWENAYIWEYACFIHYYKRFMVDL